MKKDRSRRTGRRGTSSVEKRRVEGRRDRGDHAHDGEGEREGGQISELAADAEKRVKRKEGREDHQKVVLDAREDSRKEAAEVRAPTYRRNSFLIPNCFSSCCGGCGEQALAADTGGKDAVDIKGGLSKGRKGTRRGDERGHPIQSCRRWSGRRQQAPRTP